MSETDLVQKCIRWVKDQGGYAFHIHGSAAQSAGQPDVLGAVPHKDGFKHFFIELKVGSNKPSKLQKHRLKVWGALGFIVGVAYSLDEFVALIEGQQWVTRHDE